MRRVRFKPRLRDTVRQTMAHLSAFGEIPPSLQASHDTLVAGLPKRRASKADTGTRSMGREDAGVDIDAVHRKQAPPLEKEILKACIQALRLHPRVAFVGRFNRGVVQSSYNGRDSYTQFNTVPGFPDIHGMLRGGAAFYIEVKRPNVGKLDDKQANFLASIVNYGGIAGVATSIDEAIALITSPLQG